MDEARLGASLIHSNVVPVYDFGQVDGEYYMASEYILGRDLDAVVRRCLRAGWRPLEPDTVFFVAQEVLKALGYAHTRQDAQGRPLGIVHRDVSPMNILASARGEVKLLDFGIAKSAHRSTHTRAGLVKGNVNFMAPEQARGLEVDGRADLFSLGLTLFWCLTGELLYEGQTDFDRLIQAAEGPSEAHWERICPAARARGGDPPAGAAAPPGGPLPVGRGVRPGAARGEAGGRLEPGAHHAAPLRRGAARRVRLPLRAGRRVRPSSSPLGQASTG